MKINRQFTLAALCAATVFLPTSAFANEVYSRRVYSLPRYNVQRDVSRQERRDINRVEARLEAARRRFSRDGRISRQEREEINSLERELARAVRNARRD
ncbi:hypothetical protein [Iningainema tapete]|uniref:Uncharacterized protein n=1 Tax=Iningainema tapete BLCC-T55 TaxID=2748662 RepID=A0A8J6XJE0_9CYAN|nr:hypothetical protein [Iningainema tapete]MBD2777980.1 hypothetical protein [Iningainema tapete BLCC-T55]